MPKRFFAEYNSFTGDRYNVEIWDTEFTGDPIEFKTDGTGFLLTYESDSRISTVMGTRCEVNFYLQNEDHEEIILDLLTSQEGRFLINITTGTTTPQPFWRGVVLPDIGSYEDDIYPTRFKITAADGLAALKGIKYNNDGVQYAGKETLLKHILNCLNKIKSVPVFWDNDDDFLLSYIDWWEANHVKSAGSACALFQTYVDHSAFYKDENNTQDFYTCYDVIHNILTVLGARITHANGAYWIEQITYRTAPTVIGRRYTKTGSHLGNGNFSGINTVNQTQSAALEATGVYEFLPALKEHKHTYNSFYRSNRLEGIQPFTDTNFLAVTVNRPIDNDGGVAYFRLTGNLVITISSVSAPGTAFDPFVALFGIRIKVGDFYARRNYLLTSGYQIQYQSIDWITGTAEIHFAAPISNGLFLSNTTASTFTFNFNVDIFSTNIQESGDNFEYRFRFLRFEKYDNLTVIPSNSFNFAYSFNNQSLLIYPELSEDKAIYTALNTAYPNNSEPSESSSLIGTTINPNSLGALWVKPASTYILADLWGIGTETPSVDVEYLICEYIVSGQATPIRKLQGTLMGNIVAMSRVFWRSKHWLLMRGTWNANDDKFNGEWFELNYTEGISTSPPIKAIVKQIDPQIPPAPPTSSNYGTTYEIQSKPPGTLLAAVALTTTNASILTAGPITSVPITGILTDGDVYDGDTLVILNPLSGQYDELEVTTTSTAGQTSIAVAGTLTDNYPQNSLLIKKPKIGTFTLPEGTQGDLLYHNGTKWVAFAQGASLQVLRTNAAGTALEWATLTIPGGTVTSVGLSMPGIFNVTGSPVTSSGTLTATLANQIANTVFAGPTTGGAAVPAFRALVAADIPNLDASKITSGIFPIARGGTGLGGLGTALQLLRVNAGATALEYFTFSGISGTLVAGRVVISSGTGDVTTDDVFLWDATNNVLTIGQITHGTAQYNFTRAAQNIATGIFDFFANIGANLIGYIRNTNNATANANAFLVVQVGGANAGDPFIQFVVSNAWAAGVDNSINDIFRIAPATTPSGTALGLTVTTLGRHGINNTDPLMSLDLDGNTDGILLPSGSTAQRPNIAGTLIGKVLRFNNAWGGLELQDTNARVAQITSAITPTSAMITMRPGAGTSPGTPTFGTDSNILSYQITFTTGTTPTANADVFTFTWPAANTPTRVYRVTPTPKNFNAAATSLGWWVNQQDTSGYTIAVAGTLAASTTYSLNIIIRF